MTWKNHNNIIVGFLTGLLLYGVTYVLLLFLWQFPLVSYNLTDARIPFLLSLIPNLILMRFWLMNKDKQASGKGVLLLTFLTMLAVFLFV
ncbi:MAG: hypothetical protein KJ578_09990 [Bacteroidetes bacterium]|jgi:hypothetical protein|nr:hypothetical protein [Bacteroidota bacterium]MBU1578002.1 hypothetical protein [Bacteroidota bacterium]MBU2466444.1 hypothetical protein [Bacteroidota bacterium]MBU2558095.1 hypothetical protein [Bacteroidota bacterium]MDA3943414.1 hypothetical protein [Bacteroidota bacterium]